MHSRCQIAELRKSIQQDSSSNTYGKLQCRELDSYRQFFRHQCPDTNQRLRVAGTPTGAVSRPTLVLGTGMSRARNHPCQYVGHASLEGAAKSACRTTAAASTLGNGEMSLDGVDKLTHDADFIVQTHYARPELIYFPLAKRVGEFVETLFQKPVIMFD